ncbi:hypothetical protein AUP68_10243 [Ilyonectria robusta]
MSSSDPTDSAAKAIADAIHRSAVESWTLYSIGVASTALRTYARMRGSGIRGLRTEDYLVWIGIMFYTIQSSLAYSVGSVAHGLANNGMTDAERAALSPEDHEYSARWVLS